MHFFCRRKAVVTTFDGINHLTGQMDEGLSRHCIFKCHRFTCIGMFADSGNKRYPGENRHGIFGCESIHIGIVAEEIIPFVGVFFGSEPCHIVDQTEHRHVDFRIAEHGYAFAGVGESHKLRSGDDHSAPYAESLHQSKMYVARSGRHIDEEIVEFAPVGLLYELFERVGGHRAAPYGRTRRIYDKAYRQNFHTVFLGRNDEIAAIDLMHIQFGIFQTEHLRNGRPEDIGIEKTDPIALGSQRYREIGRYSRFAYTAFARRHGHDIFHTGKYRSFFPPQGRHGGQQY